MREIQLTQGKVALVDDEDFEELSRYSWSARKDTKSGTWYALRGIRPYPAPSRVTKTILMHRQITGFPTDRIDHRNGDGLDNQKDNLREATHQQNMLNRRRHTPGLKGVDKLGNKYQARIRSNGTGIYLGLYDTAEDAYEAYKLASFCLHGEFACAD